MNLISCIAGNKTQETLEVSDGFCILLLCMMIYLFEFYKADGIWITKCQRSQDFPDGSYTHLRKMLQNVSELESLTAKEIEKEFRSETDSLAWLQRRPQCSSRFTKNNKNWKWMKALFLQKLFCSMAFLFLKELGIWGVELIKNVLSSLFFCKLTKICFCFCVLKSQFRS